MGQPAGGWFQQPSRDRRFDRQQRILSAHKDLVDTFLTEHEASIAYTAADPEGAAALIEKAGIVAKAAIAQKALPACNITYLDGQDMKDALNGYLSVLLSQNPQSVGGSLPEDDFYYLQ